MIRPIQMCNPNFSGVKNLKPQRVVRNIVNVSEQAPKGLSNTPVRALNEEGENMLKIALGALAGSTGIVSTYCATQTAAGCSLGTALA